MYNHKFAVILVNLPNQFEYYFGETELIESISGKLYQKVFNRNVYGINIWTFQDENQMLDYINEKREYYAGDDRIKFNEAKISEAV